MQALFERKKLINFIDYFMKVSYESNIRVESALFYSIGKWIKVSVERLNDSF